MSNTDPSRSIKVLVVDLKNEFHAYFPQLRHSCSFEVTSVDHSGAALRLLSENNSEFDLLMIDNDMTDVDIHTFLRLTRNMNLLSIVMSDHENDALVVEAFKSGAFLVLKRPLTIEAVRLIYQDVIRERMHKNDKHTNKIIRYVTPEVVTQEDKSSGDNKKESGELTKQLTRTNFDNNLVVQSADNDYDDGKKRICMEWTPELHEKFRNAINHLGEGRCFPKEIVRRMGVPGLTRMQVASHLQKYRNERLKCGDNQRMPTYEGYLRGVNESEFGYMPSIKTHQNDHESGILIGINTSIIANNMNKQTYWSSVMNGPGQENNAEPTPYAPFPIENGIESNQHEGFNNGIIEPGFEGFEGFDDLADFFNNLD